MDIKFAVGISLAWPFIQTKRGGSWPPFHFVPRGKYQNGLTEPRKQTDEIVIQ